MLQGCYDFKKAGRNKQSNFCNYFLIMTDPIQFIVDQQNIHKVLTHEGLLGRGRDFITGNPCSLHLYNDRFKKVYVMQQFDNVDQNFVSDKMTRATKTVHSNFISNLTKVCFVSTRKNQKGLFDLCIFYDATGVYGYSLEYIIKMKIKNEEKFGEEEIIGFFWQISDYLLLNGQQTGQFLQITPVNIFCKPDEFHGYNFFPNNFGLSFEGTKWERKYTNPKDRFWNGQRTIQASLRTTMFTFGMVLLQLCSLLPPSDLYAGKMINQKNLKKRVQGIKLTTNPLISSIIKSLLNLNEDERITIKQIFENKELLKSRKVEYFSNKMGFYKYKAFEGVVSLDRKQAFGEALDDKMCIKRGRFEDGLLEGLCLDQKQNQNIYIGLFEKGNFSEGTIIKKNESITIFSQQDLCKKGIMLRLNISLMKNEKKVLVAFEGEFEQEKPSHGTIYYSDGSQQQI